MSDMSNLKAVLTEAFQQWSDVVATVIVLILLGIVAGAVVAYLVRDLLEAMR